MSEGLVEVIFRRFYEKYQCGMLSVEQATAELGMATQTGYNRTCDGTYPVPLVRDGGKPRVRLMDLARYLAGYATLKERGKRIRR